MFGCNRKLSKVGFDNGNFANWLKWKWVLNVFLIKKYIYISNKLNRVTNEEVRRRAGTERELGSRADQRALRWFGHVESLDEYRMDRRVLMAEVSGGRVSGWPRLGWMDGVKVALGNRGMMVEAARQCEKNRSWEPCNWMSVTRQFLLGPVFFRTALPYSGGYHLERGGMPLHDAFGINRTKGATTENQGADVKYMG